MKKNARAKERRERRERPRPRRPQLEALSLPEDVTGGEVRVILLGHRRALVENCLGVAYLGRERIQLAARDGTLTFAGRELKIDQARQGEVAVVGEIEGVELPRLLREGERHD